MSSAKCFFSFIKELDAEHHGAPHEHICTEVVLNYGCSGRVFYDEAGALEYRDNTLFIYQPGHRHWVENHCKGFQYCLGICGCGVEKLAFAVLPITPEIEAISGRLREEASGNRPYMSEYMDLLAGQMALEILRVEQTHSAADRLTAPQYAQKAREILDTRFDENIMIGDLAKSLFISPDYLRQLFRESFDASPMQYLIRRRIEQACHLLWEGDMPISVVAQKSGIPNEYYFSRLFRKITGLTPSAYRKQHRRNAR